MATSKRKYFQGECRHCGTQKKLILNEWDESRDVAILRCSDCPSIFEIPFGRILKTGRVLTVNEYDEREKALSEIQNYSPEKNYWRGQTIRHPVLNETGKVIAKSETNAKQKIITVDFEDSGKKRLVEDYHVT
jgi:hypothetical protein